MSDDPTLADVTLKNAYADMTEWLLLHDALCKDCEDPEAAICTWGEE